MTAGPAATGLADDLSPAGASTAVASFLRRQVVLAAVAGTVVLAAVVVVGAVMAGGRGAAHAALRPAADGSGIIAVSPLAESSRVAVWVAGGALVAVAAVLAAALVHACRVARFAVFARSDGRTFAHEAASVDAAQEAC